MKEFIGVLPMQIAKVDDLKRNLLICSRIAIPGLGSFLKHKNSVRYKATTHLITELEWLQENGLVFDPSEDPMADEKRSYAMKYLHWHLLASRRNDNYPKTELSAAEIYLLARFNRMFLTRDPGPKLGRVPALLPLISVSGHPRTLHVGLPRHFH